MPKGLQQCGLKARCQHQTQLGFKGFNPPSSSTCQSAPGEGAPGGTKTAPWRKFQACAWPSLRKARNGFQANPAGRPRGEKQARTKAPAGSDGVKAPQAAAWDQRFEGAGLPCWRFRAPQTCCRRTPAVALRPVSKQTTACDDREGQALGCHVRRPVESPRDQGIAWTQSAARPAPALARWKTSPHEHPEGAHCCRCLRAWGPSAAAGSTSVTAYSQAAASLQPAGAADDAAPMNRKHAVRRVATVLLDHHATDGPLAQEMPSAVASTSP